LQASRTTPPAPSRPCSRQLFEIDRERVRGPLGSAAEKIPVTPDADDQSVIRRIVIGRRAKYASHQTTLPLLQVTSRMNMTRFLFVGMYFAGAVRPRDPVRSRAVGSQASARLDG
jgi:hypothetical protein